MARKSRRRKAQKTVYLSCEGIREHNFFSYLKAVFAYELSENNVRLEIDDKRKSANFGGTPEVRIQKAIQKTYHEVSIAWLDNDVEIVDYEVLKTLEKCWCVCNIPKEISLVDLKAINVKNRNPIIILAEPLTVENVIIQLLGKSSPQYDPNKTVRENVKILKNSLDGIFGFKDEKREIDYYYQNLLKSDILKRVPRILPLRKLFEILQLDKYFIEVER